MIAADLDPEIPPSEFSSQKIRSSEVDLSRKIASFRPENGQSKLWVEVAQKREIKLLSENNNEQTNLYNVEKKFVLIKCLLSEQVSIRFYSTLMPGLTIYL